MATRFVVQPSKSKRRKNVRWVVAWTVAAGTLFAGLYQEWNRKNAAKEVSKQLITASQSLKDLRDDLAKNTKIAPEVRQDLLKNEGVRLEAHSDVTDPNAMEQVYENDQEQGKVQDELDKAEEMKTEIAVNKRCAPILNYGITTLQEIVANIAKAHHDTSTSTCNPLPDLYTARSTPIGHIKLDHHPQWDFTVEVTNPSTSMNDSPRLLVTCGTMTVLINPNYSTMDSASNLIICLVGEGNRYISGPQGPMTEYPERISVAYKLMLGRMSELGIK